MKDRERAVRSLKELRAVLARGMIQNHTATRLIKDVVAAGFWVGIELALWLKPPSGESEGAEELACEMRKAIQAAAEKSQAVQELHQRALAAGIKLRCEIQMSVEVPEEAATETAVLAPTSTTSPSQMALVRNGKIRHGTFTSEDRKTLKQLQVKL